MRVGRASVAAEAYRPEIVRWRTSAARGLVLAVSAWVGLACTGCEEEPARPPNIILIVVDSLRADRLASASQRGIETPAFDQLRAQSIRFSAAYSTSSWTLPSTVSIFLSQLPSQHEVTSWSSIVREDQTSFVELLRGVGYRSAMWTANRIISGRRGLASRFDEHALVRHADHRGGRPIDEAAFAAAEEISERALAWIAEVANSPDSGPFFAYLHTMEPHSPYLCPVDASLRCRAYAAKLNLDLLDFEWDLDSKRLSRLQQLYDFDIARMDRGLGMLLEGLEASGLLDETWILLTSDHGELLGEWGMFMHGRTLYRELIHVPLFIRPPAGWVGDVETPVSLLDIAPTILGIAGLSAPAEFKGRDLGPALAGAELPARPVVSELLQVRPVPDPRRRHVVAITDRDASYRVREDGGFERVPLAAGSTPEPLSDEDFEAVARAAGFRFEASRYRGLELPDPTPEQEAALRELGYLE